MEYSDTRSTRDEDAQTGQPRHAMLRALVSAAVFGSLGALVGRWLGRHGNDKTSKIAEPMTKWSMGIFCGTLAAYSSFKASERSEMQEFREANRQSTRDDKTAAMRATGEQPATTAQADAAKNEGKLIKTSAHVALEK